MGKGEHTVLVLGAGASVAEAQCHHPADANDLPPLDSDFFQKIARHSQGRDELQRVMARSEELGQPDLCSVTQSVSLEQYLGRLYFEMSIQPSKGNVGAYYDLVRLYAAELLTTTNRIAGKKGALKRLIERELRSGQRVSVVTFNHDLLVENALDQLPERFGQPFCMRHSYGLSPGHDWCHDTEVDEFPLACKRSGRDIPIFKLHGSVNWVYRTRAEHPPADITKKRRVLFLQTSKTINPWDNTLTGTSAGGGRDTWHSWPLIVPPIYEKHGLIHGELGDVWARAADALRSAGRAIFFGYSFPRADLHARYFFQGLAQANPALARPILINPDPAAHTAIWEVLRPERVTHFRDVGEFLAPRRASAVAGRTSARDSAPTQG